MRQVSVMIAAAGLAAMSATAQADDYPFIVEALPPHLAERAAAQSGQLLLGNITAPDDFFISGLKVWSTTQPIRVCFFGGSVPMRSRIAQVANQWTMHGAYVPLDFGSLDSPRTCTTSEFNQIRVGFAYKGYWSMVGTDSVNLAAQFEQSMNLALYDINPPPEPVFSRVVLHEFGHALGFQHEHQRPGSPCVTDFDWDAIYAYLQGPPNYWSIEQIDHNLRPREQPGDETGPFFDQNSIMLYAFPITFYKTGTSAECYTPGNNSISDTDVAGLQKFYPAGISDQTQVQQEALQGFFSTIDALTDVSDEAKAVAKLTASGLSQGSNVFFAQAPAVWTQTGVTNFLATGGPPREMIDLPALYLNPPPKM